MIVKYQKAPVFYVSVILIFHRAIHLRQESCYELKINQYFDIFFEVEGSKDAKKIFPEVLVSFFTFFCRIVVT